MSRPRDIWIGTDTPFTLEQFHNKKTGEIFTGITDGTLKLYNGTTVIVTLSLIEDVTILGNYDVTVPDDQSGLSEGLEVRMQFNISGGDGLSYRLDARAICRVKKDDGL